MMDNETFLSKTKLWINNKIILASISDWYKNDARRKSAIHNVSDRFSSFLLYPKKFSVNHLAILIKRHEDLLLTIMPIPNNPSYHTAFNALSEIIKYASEIIETNKLTHML